MEGRRGRGNGGRGEEGREMRPVMKGGQGKQL